MVAGCIKGNQSSVAGKHACVSQPALDARSRVISLLPKALHFEPCVQARPATKAGVRSMCLAFAFPDIEMKTAILYSLFWHTGDRLEGPLSLCIEIASVGTYVLRLSCFLNISRCIKI